MFQPSHLKMDTRNRGRLFFHMARLISESNKKISPPIHQHSLRSPPPKISKHTADPTTNINRTSSNVDPKNTQRVPVLHTHRNIFSDQTGAFPIISSRGYRYILCMYVYDINAILFRCLKTKTGNEHLDTFKNVHQLLITRGIQPKYVRMDNE